MEELAKSLEKLKILLTEKQLVSDDVLRELYQLLETKQGAVCRPLDSHLIGDILVNVHEVIQQGNAEVKSNLFRLIAELAKSEEVRVPCVQANLIPLALGNLDVQDPSVKLQALRALGNICCDNEPAKEILLQENAAEKIVKTLKSFEETFDENADNRAAVAACGTVLNISDDDETLAEEAIACGAIPYLLGLAKQSIHTNVGLFRMAVSAVISLMQSENGKSKFLECEGLAAVIKMLKETEDEEISGQLLELLTSLLGDDSIKKAMLELGFVEYALKVANSSETQDSEVPSNLKLAVDALVMLLTEDECMQQMFNGGEGAVLNSCTSWLSSNNPHLQISGALAIGNFARTDANCTKLVEIGIHRHLIKLLEAVVNMEDAAKYHQAVFSALRNLAMPAANKPSLVACGVLDVLFSLLPDQSSFVQFKLLGTLRMLAMGQADVVVATCDPVDRLQTIVQCACSSGHPGVQAEGTRILALIAKQAQNTDVVHKLIECGAQVPIISMLDADYPIQQNESLIALAMIISKADAALHPKLLGKQIIRKSMDIIQAESVNPQTCYNAMTVLETFTHIELFQVDMPIGELNTILNKLSSHGNPAVRQRAQATLHRMGIQNDGLHK